MRLRFWGLWCGRSLWSPILLFPFSSTRTPPESRMRRMERRARRGREETALKSWKLEKKKKQKKKEREGGYSERWFRQVGIEGVCPRGWFWDPGLRRLWIDLHLFPVERRGGEGVRTRCLDSPRPPQSALMETCTGRRGGAVIINCRGRRRFLSNTGAVVGGVGLTLTVLFLTACRLIPVLQLGTTLLGYLDGG